MADRITGALEGIVRDIVRAGGPLDGQGALRSQWLHETGTPSPKAFYLTTSPRQTGGKKKAATARRSQLPEAK